MFFEPSIQTDPPFVKRVTGLLATGGSAEVMNNRNMPGRGIQVDETIEPGSPWENGYAESFNSRMRDELLNGELFLHIDEMKYVVERWRMDYNHYRPHSSLGYMTPAGFAELCRQAGCLRPQTPVPSGVQDCGILS